MKTIIWESDLNKARTRAKSEEKYILMDFYNPG